MKQPTSKKTGKVEKGNGHLRSDYCQNRNCEIKYNEKIHL